MSIFDQRRGVLSVLGAGFALVIGLLAVVAYVGITRSQRIHEGIGQLVREHLAHETVLDRVDAERQTLGALLLQIYQRKGVSPANTEQILGEIQDSQRRMLEITASLDSQQLRDSSTELLRLSQSFAKEIHAVAQGSQLSEAELARLVDLNLKLVTLSTEILKDDAEQSAEIESHIDLQTEQLSMGFILLLGASIAVSTGFAILALWLTRRFLDRLERQTAEFNQVSWQMLHGQEESARRFSHEMHDELGQSLAGLKAMLFGMSANQFEGRRRECIDLLDETIGNVRELSQLLRPVILDDFGLAEALRWLCERFTERTRIPVEFESNLSARQEDETETHLFRIAQEALTNIARHAEATRATVRIEQAGQSIKLSIEDNGKGLTELTGRQAPSIGMIGMRARARQVCGDLSIRKSAMGGVAIEAIVPLKNVAREEEEEHEPQNAHLAG